MSEKHCQFVVPIIIVILRMKRLCPHFRIFERIIMRRSHLIYSLFSSLTGYCISSFSPKDGVIWPFNIAATPEIIGNLKSRILGSTFVISNCCRARVVATPSVVSLVARMSSKVSPLAKRTPTCLPLIHT